MNSHSHAHFAKQHLRLCLYLKANSIRLNANFLRKNLINNAYNCRFIYLKANSHANFAKQYLQLYLYIKANL